MKNQEVTIKSIGHATHDVLHIVTEKPEGMDFHPGQATEIFVEESGWENEGRPFTFTGLPSDDHLEFMIKTYPEHAGVTNKLLELKKGDELIINDIFGAIAYKGEGTFIAGGAGVTPFISIFRDLSSKNELGKSKLLFANKTVADIIHKDEFTKMLGQNFINILSQDESDGFEHGLINEDFLKIQGVNDHDFIYLCGPRPMMDSIEEQLHNLHVKEDAIVKEVF